MKEHRTTEKLIITVAPTGGYHGKEVHPHIPLQPEEIARAVRDAWNEGASIAHVHARERDTNQQTTDPNVLRDIDQRIREAGCDIIVQHSTAKDFVPRLPEDRRIRAIEMNPEMASLDVTFTRLSHFQGTERISVLTLSDIEHAAREMLRRGVKPELEIFNPVAMRDIVYLIENGLLHEPYWIGLVFGMRRTNRAYMPYRPELLMRLADQVPDGSLFTVAGIAADELPAITESILLGGHIRVGLEDNIFYRKGRLAESSAQLVGRAVRIARELGCEIATPAEAREILGLFPFSTPTKGE
jgi:3-keto-5-aminohexanoate cleavage enzyme